MLQELRPGLRVAARGDRWRVASVTAWTDCTEVRLAGLSASNDAQERLLLAPFDRFEPLDVARGGPFDSAQGRPFSSAQGRPLDVARVSRRAWMRALAGAAAASRPACGLQAAHRATIDLLPWQLEPALALARGAASRVLVADAVGLGKTVQALAALAELDARGEAERVLIVTPAGLRDQWSGELAARFGRTCIVADAAFLAAAARDLPPGVNPWSLPGVYVVSLDFLKRREVLRGIEELWWDLTIADEAHLAAPGTDRRAALDRAAGRAARVILLTATPYASDRDGYDALCAIGHRSPRITIGHGSPRISPDSDLIVFRRTRGSLGLDVPARRTRVVQVRLTPAERRLHRLLERYTSRVWRESPSAAARLAMIVLRKRALSSAWAAGRTIERRLALLNQPEDSLGRQASLPFDPDEEGEASADDTVSDAILGAPGLTDNRFERDALSTLAAAAVSAAHESKLRALKRILARTRDAAIVFTEYRDTLEHLAKHLTAIRRHAVLHGGLSRDERRAASTALNEGSVTLLLATDAAGEGLNLHYRCRWVINFELPWNPARLEQRAGRVDRYGQRRRPHAMHLVACDTAESVVLARLEARIRRARQAGWLDDVWPAEPTVAAAILGGDGLPIEASARARERAAVPDAIQALAVQACADAAAVAPSALWRASPKLQRRRALVRAPGSFAPQLPLLLEVKQSRLARGRNGLDCLLTGGRSLFVYRIDIRNGAGRIVDSTLIGALDHEAGGRHYDDPKGSYYNDERLGGVQAFRDAAVERLLARWRTIAASPIAAARPEVQPALFDRRALDLARTAESARMSLERDLAMRVDRLERSRTLTTEPPELLLIARPCPEHRRGAASTRTDGRS